MLTLSFTDKIHGIDFVDAVILVSQLSRTDSISEEYDNDGVKTEGSGTKLSYRYKYWADADAKTAGLVPLTGDGKVNCVQHPIGSMTSLAAVEADITRVLTA